MTTAALLVTSNSQRWIEQTLRSVLDQERSADEVVVIDDNSTDGTRQIVHDLLGGNALVVRATSQARDLSTRIAENFLQGVRACADHEVVVLGDHDDLWHADRIARQVAALDADPTATLLAGDGRLIDADNRLTGGTLRGAFPVPGDWAMLDPVAQVAYALRHSIATGGASALRPGAFIDEAIPPGWLHDRWWSLLATVMGGMRIEDATAIDYRVTETQQVGLATGTQARSAGQRLRTRSRDPRASVQRLRDLSGLRERVKSDDVRRELAPWRLVLAGLGR